MAVWSASPMLARVVDVYAKRLQIQEKMTAQIANTINDVLKPQGVGGIIKATHHSMTTRGVQKPRTDLVTTRILGCLRDNQPTPHSFLDTPTPYRLTLSIPTQAPEPANIAQA